MNHTIDFFNKKLFKQEKKDQRTKSLKTMIISVIEIDVSFSEKKVKPMLNSGRCKYVN